MIKENEMNIWSEARQDQEERKTMLVDLVAKRIERHFQTIEIKSMEKQLVLATLLKKYAV